MKIELNKNLIVAFAAGLGLGITLGSLIGKKNQKENLTASSILDVKENLKSEAKATQENFKNVQQIKTKKTIRKANGDSVTLEKTKTDLISKKVLNTNLNLDLQHNKHENSQIITNNFEQFNVAFFSEISANDIKNINDYEIYFGIKLIHNVNKYISNSLKYRYSLDDTHSIAIESEVRF